MSLRPPSICSPKGACWPGIKTIARELKLSPRTVQRALNDLERAGLTLRQPRFRENGSRTSNRYLLQPPRNEI